MTSIVVSVILGLLVNECSDVCPWCARKLVEWSAHRRYTDPDRAAVRAEELAAVIEGRPGKLLKLFSALGFAGSAFLVACMRELARRRSARMSRRSPDAGATVPLRHRLLLLPFRSLPDADLRRRYTNQMTADLAEIERTGGSYKHRLELDYYIRQILPVVWRLRPGARTPRRQP